MPDLPLSDTSSEEEMDEEPVTENEGDSEEWEDDKEKDQIATADLLDIFQRSSEGWNKRVTKWAKTAHREAAEALSAEQQL